MTPVSLAAHSLGAFTPGDAAPRSGPDGFRDVLAELGAPVSVVAIKGRPAIVKGGTAAFGAMPNEPQLPLLGHAPALTPDRLGDAGFRQAYGVDAAFVVGEMANGIASEALVEAASNAGLLGVFGAAGLSVPRVTAALDRLQSSLVGKPWAINLIHSPDDPRLELALVDLFLARNVPVVSASAYLDLTLPVVKWRVSGIRRDPSGQIVARKLIAKISRVEVAKKFLEPPPARFLEELVSSGVITREQAELAAQIPMADDVTAEADSGGHTDNRPLVLLLPAIQALRDEVCTRFSYTQRPRIGAAGGIATPESVATAFAMGAAYVVTGSINQATREAGTSDLVRKLLAQAAPTDVAMAPAADMFELGVKVQVLTRGTLFAVRAQRLYELYRSHDSIAALPKPVRDELESKFFRTTLEDAWAGCERFFAERDPSQLTRAQKEPKHQLALLFRSYLGQASKWANDGVADRSLDFQIWCGPAMGAFNAWVKGSVLEDWQARDVVTVSKNLLVGACVLTRVAALRSQGVVLPAEVEHFAPRSLEALSRLVERREKAPVAVQSEALTAAKTPPRRKEPIAIVGIGALFPQAASAEALWRLLRTGKDAVGDVPATHFSIADYFDADPKAPDMTYAKRGAFLPTTDFDPTAFGIPPAILEATDTSQLLALVVAKQALEDAGYPDDATWDRSRTSVLLGVTGTQELVIALGARLGHPKWKKALSEAGVDPETAKDVVERISASYVGWQENSFPGLLGNVVAGRIANRFDLGGTNAVVDAACASSLGALHLGLAELESGRSDMVLTGGVDTLNDIFMHMCFSKTPALSATGDARPFSDKADGTLLGEGLGMLVLKRLSDAERDGDRIYALIRGLGTSSDGRAKSIYAPLSRGQARALRNAYDDANVTPRDITLLEAHGTGTKAGDAAEFAALDEVFRADSTDAAWCVLGSVKSQVGHTKAAAGAAGLIKAALALHHKVLPPTLKVDRPNPALALEQSPFAIAQTARPWLRSPRGPRLAAVSSFGFGGSNFHTVLEEYRPTRALPAWDGSVELLAISASDQAGLVAKAEALLAEKDRAQAFAASRSSFSPSAPFRLVAVVEADQPLERSLRPAIEKVKQGAPFVSPEGVAFSHGAPRGSLAFVFPGQGSQHVDMLRDLATVFPELLESVVAQPEIAEKIYPLPTFDDATKAQREAALTRTDVAQPAIGAVSRGVLAVLRRFGVRPALVAGHSYGELVALHAAGVLDDAALVAASLSRGQLMAGDGSDRGTMLAVLAPVADVEQLLADEKLELVIANRNGPGQFVLSGTRDAIARAEAGCKARGLRATKLNVGAAFHSALVAGAAAAFQESLRSIRFQAPSLPVIANTTAQAYPESVDEARALLAHQLANPVRFDAVVEELFRRGARTFVEVGPKTALTGLIKAILGDRPHHAMAVDTPSKRGGVFELAWVLARVAAEGHAVDLPAWQQTARPPRWVARPARAAKMAVPLTGANYRAPTTPKPPRAPAPVRAPGPVTNGVHVNGKNGTTGVAPQLPAPVARPTGPSGDALALYQENLKALQALQEQTARVHQLFLEGQLAAQQNVAALLTGAPPPSLATRAPTLSAPVTTAVVAPEVAPTPAPMPQRASHLVAPVEAEVRPVAVAPAPAQVEVVPLLLQVVSEATGYPLESLALSMDLEADLGIDSIKRVEILSMVSRRVPGAPSVDPERLGALKTLQQIADFVRGSTTAPTPSVTSSVTTAPAIDARAILLGTVSELTGYPLESLSVEMDLEADLGIDSIKRVEILSLLSRRVPGAPSVDPEKLAGLKTLAQVHAFIGQSTGAVHAEPPKAAPTEDPEKILFATVSELTGYPVDTLARSMDLEADLGIDSIKRVEILSLLSRRLPGAPSVDPEKLSGLKTLEQVLAFVKGNAPAVQPVAPVPAAPATAVAPTPKPSMARRVVVPVRAKPPGPVLPRSSERVVIADGDPELARALAKAFERAGQRATVMHESEVQGAVGTVVLTAPFDGGWSDASEQILKRGLQLARSVGPALRSTSNASFIAVSRRDGAFGLGQASVVPHPLAGAFTGLIKTLALEWPEVRCRSVDLSSLWSVEDAAQALVDELSNEGPLELGLGPSGRVTTGLREQEILGGSVPLASGDVVVVTGGARGVTADCARALAKETGATLLLLGRSPAPTEEPDWLRAAGDDAALKRVLLERAPAGNRPSPRQLAESARQVLAARDIRASLESAHQVGVKAEYRQVDVRDVDAVRSVLEEARATLGPIRGMVHGAGVLRDKRVEDKRDDDFDQVLDPKIAGLRALLEATRSDELTLVAFFASVSGRFGRKGQSDYALANQALVSIAVHERRLRPSARVVALDWGPWAGGMVTPALEATFAAEGVSLIPLEQGAKAFVDELRIGAAGPAEVVLGAGFGDAPEAGWALVRTERVDSTWPVLADHRLQGRSVLPFALSLEWLLEAARTVADGRRVTLEDVRVLRGVTLEGEREELSLWVGRLERRAETLTATVELRSRKDVVHVRGTAVIGDVAPTVERLKPLPGLPAFTTPVSELYASQLFHGPGLWAIRSIEGLGEDGLALTLKTHPTSERLVPGPSRSWQFDPLCVDGIFQALIVWSRARNGAPCLPSRVGVLVAHRPLVSGDVKAIVRIRAVEGATVIADVELHDAAGLAGQLVGAEATISATLSRAFIAEPSSVQPIA